MEFPTVRPDGTNYIRPRASEAVEISPPGFCWWRADERGTCRYRLIVRRDGAAHYTSPLTSDPIHVPDAIFPPGPYTWVVEAVGEDGIVGATTGERAFSITENAIHHPWTDPRTLLDNVPTERPRIFFTADELETVRATLATTRVEAFQRLKEDADAALATEPIPEPDYDRIEDAAERRLAYHACFQATRKVHDHATRVLALTWLLTGERKYGDHAKTLIVDAAGWDPEGISSITAPYGDEVGLGLLRIGAEVYDWLHPLFTDAEESLVRSMVGARADQMIRQLERSDYTFRPEGSHNGRLPGFLLEHAIALAEDERASGWAEYALKIIWSNFPHWAGQDGGWAQGVPYGMSYNSRDAMPFHAWQKATGDSVWDKPFYRKLPWFFYYVVSPVGEIMPFGDTEHQPVRPSQAKTLMFFHGQRLGDPRLLQWADQTNPPGGHPAEIDPFPGILVEDVRPSESPDPPPNDRVFRGVGWGALHSDITAPRSDFMVLFRSSPYGGVSHGHASQNDFAVMKGGRALICAGGERFPHHGTPFHNEYAQQSLSHNCVLVDGVGAVNRDGNRGGEIVDFSTSDRIGYVAGEAGNAYDHLTRYRRHLVMVRPDILILVDELESPEPASFQWLLHAWDPFELDAEDRTLVAGHRDAELSGRLFASTDFTMAQTDEWPVAPDKGYPTLEKPLPPKRWHFTAETERVPASRIAAVLTCRGPGETGTDVRVHRDGDTLSFEISNRNCVGEIDLDPESEGVLRIDLEGEPKLRIDRNP